MNGLIFRTLSFVSIMGTCSTGPEWNGCHSLMYDVYFIRNDEQLNETIAFEYGAFEIIRVSTGVDWEAAKVMEAYE